MRIVARFFLQGFLWWLLVCGAASADEQAFQGELRALVAQFDRAQFELPAGEGRLQSLEAALTQATGLQKQFPFRAELLCWEGWILIAQSDAMEGLGILDKRIAARQKLEEAIAIDPTLFEGAPYVSLGDLYYLESLFPFPLFRSGKAEADRSYRKALELDPAGLASNVHYSSFLIATRDYAGALKHATAAVNSQPLKNRAAADTFLRKVAHQLAADAREKMQ